MIITLKELNKFMPHKKLDLSIEKDINNLGYEVESITRFSDVKGVKFAKVINVYPNPNSKNLTVVELELAKKEKITIQTTAKNAEIGCYTTAFVVGSQKGDIVFGSKTMAQIESQGMLANFNELGFDISKLPFNVEDVMMLKDPLPLDADPVEYFGLDDYIIDITTPANRPDSNSYYVLARELAAYYNTKFDWFDWLNPKIEAKFKTKVSSSKEQSHALSFMEVKLKKNKTKLLDMLFLAKHGVEAKNNWAIDISNLALIFTGAPTHAYDKDKIACKLRSEKFSGKVQILGGKEVEVEDVLAIQDSKGPISLACVMGLEQSSVDSTSKNVLFEIGCFDAPLVRKAAKQIKIESASSIQGGRGVNTQMLRFGMHYLRYKAAVDKIAFSNFVGKPAERKGFSVLQNRKKLAIYANWDIKDLNRFDFVEHQLKTIGFKMDKNRVTAPNYRKDINTYEDVIEEYFRFYGYDKFEAIKPTLVPFKVAPRNITKDLLQSLGYKEVRTFTLDSEQNNFLNPFNFNETIKLQTFVSKDREVIRNSIITSMLQVAEYNIKRKIDKINIFECGMINNNHYTIGLITNTKSFDALKQDIINYLKITNLEFIKFDDNKYIHPNVSAKIMHKNEMIGWIGKVHPAYSNLDLWVAEFKDISASDFKLFTPYDNAPLKNVDLTFELKPTDSIATKINEISQKYSIFSIYQIDEYKTSTSRKVTIRISANSQTIDLINQQYN